MHPHHLIPDAPFASYADYLAATGPSAVPRARAMGGDAVLAELARSGLRGRGGAGFPTAVKWRTIAGHPCSTRYVVCNAAEGEPGTFKDRFLIRRNPYATLEGMLIAAGVVGASEIYIALKSSFTPELARLRAAIAEMTAAGLFEDQEIHVVEGPEEYLFGEEKALLEVVEGNDPLPRESHNPPYEKGLFATAVSPNPALVNNVQTFAHVPSILRLGGESFREIGTRDTPGTLLFTISGDVQRPGVYELPAGIPLRRIFDEIAGGARPGRRFKVALSGVSSPVLLAERFDAPADFASLHVAGGSLGSAGFIVLDDSAWMPRVAQSLARFLYVESCNQCSACKHGLRTASSAIDELFDPALATPDVVERALHGARSAPQGNRCYLPVQGSILIPDLLSRFRDEFTAQLADPTRPSPRYVVPTIVDFDEATRTFTYDATREYKQPNWTYDEPAPPSLRPAGKPASPGAPPRAPANVRLRPDVHEGIVEAAAQRGHELERVVNDALRDWLARERK